MKLNILIVSCSVFYSGFIFLASLCYLPVFPYIQVPQHISVYLTFKEEFLHILSFYPIGIVGLDENKTKTKLRGTLASCQDVVKRLDSHCHVKQTKIDKMYEKKGVSFSFLCCNKLPQTLWLKVMPTYFAFLTVKSLKWISLGWNWSVCRKI